MMTVSVTMTGLDILFALKTMGTFRVVGKYIVREMNWGYIFVRNGIKIEVRVVQFVNSGVSYLYCMFW